MRPFILAGGLTSLVEMFEHKNLHLRGQAIELFRDLTSEEVFHWHDVKRDAPKESMLVSSFVPGLPRECLRIALEREHVY